jgi:tRNA(Ile2) C34 agmatinyltransferase TiaS
MKTYIDAKSLIDELSAACMPICEKGITGILGDNSSIADIINEQPAVDVQEVKHGRWVYKERTKVVNTDNVGILEGYRTITEENIDKATIILKKRITVKVPFCSLCGEHGDNEGDATPYCPYCGARMDSEKQYKKQETE